MDGLDRELGKLRDKAEFVDALFAFAREKGLLGAKPGRKPGSVVKKRRKRRTKAEMQAAREAEKQTEQKAQRREKE